MFTIITNYKKLFLLTLRSEFGVGNPDNLAGVAQSNRPDEKRALDSEVNKMLSNKMLSPKERNELVTIIDNFEKDKVELKKETLGNLLNFLEKAKWWTKFKNFQKTMIPRIKNIKVLPVNKPTEEKETSWITIDTINNDLKTIGYKWISKDDFSKIKTEEQKKEILEIISTISNQLTKQDDDVKILEKILEGKLDTFKIKLEKEEKKEEKETTWVTVNDINKALKWINFNWINEQGFNKLNDKQKQEILDLITSIQKEGDISKRWKKLEELEKKFKEYNITFDEEYERQINDGLKMSGYKWISKEDFLKFNNEEEVEKILELITSIWDYNKRESKEDNIRKLEEIFISKKITLLKDSQELEEVQVPEIKAEKVAPAPLETAKLSPEKAEKEYNERLDKALDPKTHIFLDLGDGEILVIWWKRKDKLRETILNLSKTLNSDQKAVYTILELLSRNKDEVKTISKIYDEANWTIKTWDVIQWSQVIIKKWESKDFALFNSRFSEDVKLINIDKWSKILDAIWNTFFLWYETAEISEKNLKKWKFWRNASSTDFDKWFLSGKKSMEPMNRFEKEGIIDNLAKEIRDIILDDKEDSKNEKIAGKYLLSLKDNSNDPLKALKEFRKNKANRGEQLKYIKEWLKTQEKDLFPQNEWVTISENWFVTFNTEEIAKDNNNIKVLLKWVEWKGKDWKKLTKDKEVYLKKWLVTFDELNMNFDKSVLSSIKFEPIFLEKDWLLMQITKDWVYIIWEWTKKWTTKAIDKIKDNEVAIAWIVWGIIWACIVKWINFSIHLPNLSFNLPKIPKISFDTIKAELWRIPDNINSFAWWAILWYIFTAIPLNIKIEWLKTELYKTKAIYETWGALDREIDWNFNNDDKEELLKYYKWKDKSKEIVNRSIHKLLVSKGILGIWEATWLVFELKKDWDNYLATSEWKWEESKMLINWIEYYIPEGEKISIKLDKDLNIISKDGKLKEKRTNMWMDLFAKDFNTTLQDVLNKTNVEKKSVEK